MELYGREVGFRLDMGAACDLCELVPSGDIKEVLKMISAETPFARQGGFSAQMVVVLSKQHEIYRKITEPGYKPNPLTLEEVRSLDFDTFGKVFEEAFAKFGEDAKITVETTPVTGKKEEEVEQKSD